MFFPTKFPVITDVKLDLEEDTNWISNSYLKRKLKSLKANNIIIIADSCFSGSLLRGIEPVDEEEVSNKTLLERNLKKRIRLIPIQRMATSTEISNYIYKDLNKSCIYVGGALQLFFGINGNRWKNNETINKYKNAHWINTLKEDIPKNHLRVEGSAYWS